MKRGAVILLFIAVGVESMMTAGDLISRLLFRDGLLSSAGSVADFTLAGSLVLLSIGSLLLLLKRNFREKAQIWIEGLWSNHPASAKLILWVLLLIAYESFQDIIFIHSEAALIHYPGYRTVLLQHYSLLVWALLVSFQTLIVFSILNWHQFITWLKKHSTKELGLIIILSVVLITGFDRDKFGSLPAGVDTYLFEELNAPLLGLQVGFIVLCVVGILILLDLIEKRFTWLSAISSDLGIYLILAIIAFISWYGVPLQETTFVDSPRPPNYEYYPRSDALNYQISAERLQDGYGTDRVVHAGYWQFLAIIQWVAGNNYQIERIIHLAILSIIPALLYLLTKYLGNRLAGLLTALFYIARETNALMLVKYITIPQIKDWMTEPVTILGILLMLVLLANWAKYQHKRNHTLLLAGGLLGWAVLLRVEALVFLPAVAIGLLFYFRKNLSKWLRPVMIYTLGLLLVIGPWLYFSLSSTGSLGGREKLLLNPTGDVAAAEQSAQEPLDQEQFYSANLKNNLIQLFYYLPSNHQPLLTINNLPRVIVNGIDPSDYENDTYRVKYLERYVRSLPFWWDGWDGHVPKRSRLPLIFSLALILLGYMRINPNKKSIALIMISMTVLYMIAFTVVGRSGGRFILVVDWIPLVFYGIGLSLAVSKVIYSKESTRPRWITSEEVPGSGSFPKESRFSSSVVFVFLVLMGFSVPFGEYLIPPRFTEQDLETGIAAIAAGRLEPSASTECPEIGTPDIKAVLGYALFPRYFSAGETFYDHNRGGYTDFQIARTEFYLVGTENLWVAVPGELDLPEFPHHSRVLVVGKMEQSVVLQTSGPKINDYLQADCLVFMDGSAIAADE